MLGRGERRERVGGGVYEGRKVALDLGRLDGLVAFSHRRDQE